MKVWVVSGEGLLGHDVCLHLAMKNVPYVFSVRSSVDISDFVQVERFFEKETPTHIVNCAAYTNVDLAETEKEEAYRVNADGPYHLAKIAKRHGAKLLHVSTDYVFDGLSKKDYREEDPTHAINVYGQSKLEGEERALDHYPQTLSVRTASLYGHHKDGLITSMVKALQTKEEVSHFADQVSTPTFTRDFAEGLWTLRDETGIFHLVNQGHCSRFELLQKVYELLQKHGLPIRAKKLTPKKQNEIKRAAKRPPRSVLSIQKVQKIIPSIRSWERALEEYFKEHFSP